MGRVGRLIGQCEGKRPLGRCGCGLEDNAELDLSEMG
jgi:hypothetical protein